METENNHRVTVLDRDGITACDCGMQVFAHPGMSALFGAFVDAHSEAVL